MYADQNALPEDAADLMNPLTARLKQMLWPRHGQAAFPAEWDGRVYGGGRISQRFWEYHKSIEMLDLEESSVVLAIGGGSPATGISFFPRLLADAGLPVFVLDVHFGDNPTVPENVTLIHGVADEATLYVLLKRIKPTDLSCIPAGTRAGSAAERHLRRGETRL